MKFKSEFFSTPRALSEERDRLWGDEIDKRRDNECVSGFYNGRSLKTPEQAEQDGEPADIVNHLLGYRNLKRQEDAYDSIYSSTNRMVEIMVKTDTPEADDITSQRLSNAINKAIYFSGEFENLWQSVSGEIPMKGKVPLMFNRTGWCPRFCPNVLYPKNSSPVSGKVTYAFAPYELTYVRLKDLEASVKGSESKFIDLTTVKLLLNVLKDQIAGKGVSQSTEKGYDNDPNPMDERMLRDSRNSIPAWKYYEVTFDEKTKKKYVSETLFTEKLNLSNSERTKARKEDGEEKIVSYRPKAFEDPTHWLHTLMVDSQIGGAKTVDRAKGLAEITFNSDTDAEDLLNRYVSGEKLRALPKFEMGENANPDQVAQWRPYEDSVMPSGLKPVQVYASNNLLAPLQVMRENTARLTGGSVSNAGAQQGELQKQAQQRQMEDASMGSNRLAKIYTPADRLLAEIVRRFLLIETKPGQEGYEDIMWVRECLDQYKIPYKELAKMHYGRFKYIEVRVARVIGSGDRESELFVATFLKDNLQNYDPQVRPFIMRKITALISRDPALAEYLVTLPEIITNTQRGVAENEFDTILRRAAVGYVHPVNAGDVHEDHVPSHLLDFQAYLTELQAVQPQELDMRRIAAITDHIVRHLQAMSSMPASAGAAKVYQGQLQQLEGVAQKIIAQYEETQAAMQQPGLTPKEEADIAIKMRDQELDAQKLGLQYAQFEEIVKSRESRASQGNRKQYANEVKTAKQLEMAEQDQKLKKEKVKQDARKIEITASKPKSKSSSSSK